MNNFTKKGDYKILIVFLIIFLSLILFFFSSSNNITGQVTYDLTGAGNVTEVNTSITTAASYWQAFNGELLEDSSSNQTPSAAAQGGGVTELNLTLSCLGEEIYASTDQTITLQDITAGDKEAVDDYLQLDASQIESGSSVFSSTSSFQVYSTNVTNVPTTYTKVYGSPGNTTFSLGLLNESNNLVFVTPVSYDSIGFDNELHDYQMMVPVNLSGATYYFFSDCLVSYCGDLVCDPDEDCSSCPQDCGVCPVVVPPTGGARVFPFCGDRICQRTENCSTCPLDCGACPEIIVPVEEIPEVIIEEEILPPKYPLSFLIIIGEHIPLLKEILFTTKGIVLLLIIIVVLLIFIMNGIYNKKKPKKKIKNIPSRARKRF